MKSRTIIIVLAAILVTITALLLLTPASGVTIAANGKAKAAIILGPDATPTERYAASQLAVYLRKITGDNFKISNNPSASKQRIFVGQTSAVKKLMGNYNWSSLESDGILITTKGNDLILSGDRPRGSLYAVYTFLEDQLGVKFWAPNAETVPKKRSIKAANLNISYTPKLRCRETYFQRVMQENPDFPIKMKLNGHFQKIPQDKGGHYSILGFCHTFYQLLPPEKYFSAHPEWYSEIDGKRIHDRAQLCLTNEEMKAELIKQAFVWIKANPQAGIISIAQNDWANPCNCDKCRALVAKTGSQSGALVAFVNSVAEQIEKQYPDFLVETLAYQYTRQAPTNIKPRDNVLIRLCSIECDFSQPVTSETNKTFYKDLQDWKKISKLLYIWDYTVNFANLLIPHANFQVLGDNLRTFVDNNAIGMFEQGDGYNPDAAFASMKTWVLSKLMWDPNLDEKKLIEEFLNGYYGEAAPHLADYMNIMEKVVADGKVYLGCFNKPQYYKTQNLEDANAAMQKALEAVKDNPVLLNRVKIQYLALQHLMIITKRQFAISGSGVSGIDWNNIAQEYLELSDKTGNVFIGEGSQMDEKYRKSLVTQATQKMSFKKPSPPDSCVGLSSDSWIDFQEDRFNLAGEGEWVVLRDDNAASNGMTAEMPGNTNQWAVQVSLQAPDIIAPTVEVKAMVKVKAKSKTGPAFTFGVYNPAKSADAATAAITLDQINDDGYHEYTLGKVTLKPGMFVYFAPPKNGDLVESVSIDRVFFVAVK